MNTIFRCTLLIAVCCELFEANSDSFDERNSAVSWEDFGKFMEDVYSQSHEEKRSYQDQNPALERDLFREYQQPQRDTDTLSDSETKDEELADALLYQFLADSTINRDQQFQQRPGDIDDAWDAIAHSDFLDNDQESQRLLAMALLQDMVDNDKEATKQREWQDIVLDDFSEEDDEKDRAKDFRDEEASDYTSPTEDSVTSDGKKERGQTQDEKTKDGAEKIEDENVRSENSQLLSNTDEDELRSLLTQMAASETDNTDSAKASKKKESSAKISTNTTTSDEIKITVQFPGVSVTQDDTYLCTAAKIDQYSNSYNKSLYITKYVPHAKQTVAHHMLLYGCMTPGLSKTGAVWNCGGTMEGSKKGKFPSGNLCGKGQSTILWAWAKDAPPFTLPKDIGFKVGVGTNIQYLVLQVHYKSASVFRGGMKDHSAVTVEMTKTRQPHLAGVYILASMFGTVQPHTQRNFDIQCKYTKAFPIHPFAFRTHTHALGVEVIGFRIRDGDWTLIGAKNPQLPEAFYPVATKNMTIRYGDYLAGRCVMRNFRNIPTSIGWRHTDEMCNFYIMFWADSKYEEQLDSWQKSCDNGYPWVHWSSLPGYYT